LAREFPLGVFVSGDAAHSYSTEISLDILDILGGPTACGGVPLGFKQMNKHQTEPTWPPIMVVAAALGLPLEGRDCRCFNGSGHVGGDDRTPSLKFYEDGGRFFCFGCGISGDAVDLVRKLRGWSFPEAVEFLAGLSNAQERATARIERQDDNLVALQSERALRAFSALYEASEVVSPATTGGGYLARRGIDPDLAARHGVRELLPVWGHDPILDCCSRDELDAAGLVLSSGRFLFARHHLLFFYLEGGKPVFIQARSTKANTDPKELNPKRFRCPVPYNVDVLERSPDEVWIAEGCIDTLSLVQMGYAAVGVPGVHGFRDEWLSRFDGVGQTIICFDNDGPGQQAAAELSTRFRLRGLRVKVRRPSHGSDVNEMLVSSMEDRSNGT